MHGPPFKTAKKKACAWANIGGHVGNSSPPKCLLLLQSVAHLRLLLLLLHRCGVCIESGSSTALNGVQGILPLVDRSNLSASGCLHAASAV